MEFITHFLTAFIDGFNRFIGSFSALFEYFISIGVRQEALIVILIGGGLSLIILMVALFMVLSKVKLRKGTPPPAASARRANAEAGQKNTTRFSAMFRPKHAPRRDPRSDDMSGPDGSGEKKVTGKGFTIFKKRSRLRPKPSEGGQRAAPAREGDMLMGQLAEIERDMLAVKELYQSGHIQVDVYVTETRVLYEKAKALS